MSLVVFAGNIGAGKTTAASELASRLQLPLSLELVEENPFLGPYYNDMHRWSFSLAAFNLQYRSKQIIELDARSGIIDRSIYEDRHIFVRLQREHKLISEDDFSTYCQLWDLIVPNLRKPDLMVFLDSPIELCLQRIKIRNRGIESDIPYEYMASLDRYYSEWIASFDECPVLRLNADVINYVKETNAIDEIVNSIKLVL